MQTNAVNGRNADRAADDILHFLQAVVEGIVGLDDLFAVIVKDFALASETEFFLAAFNQERLKSSFQRADLLRNRGLRNLVYLRCFRKTFGLGKITKHFQTLNLHPENEQQ